MRRPLALLLTLLLSAPLRAEPIKYILDTDLASDCDDAGAAALMHALADNGDVDILATMISTGGQYGAPALCAINTFYGRADLPVGTVKAPKFWVGGSPDKPSGAFNFESFNRPLAERFPTRIKRGNNAPDARLLYRQTLAKQPDKSVVINSIGPLINLALLMETKPDEHSPLNGTDLIRAKVKLLVITGGRNPAGTSSNFSKLDAETYTKPVIDRWPTRVVYVGNDVGLAIRTGWTRNADAHKDNPARAAYDLFFKGKPKKHASANQAGVLYAIRGTGDLFTLVENGHQACDDQGHTKWVDARADGKDHAYLSKRDNVDARLAETLETLMTQPRKHTK